MKMWASACDGSRWLNRAKNPDVSINMARTYGWSRRAVLARGLRLRCSFEESVQCGPDFLTGQHAGPKLREGPFFQGLTGLGSRVAHRLVKSIRYVNDDLSRH